MQSKTRKSRTRRDRRLAKASHFNRLPRKAGRVGHGTALPVAHAQRLKDGQIPESKTVQCEHVGNLRVTLGELHAERCSRYALSDTLGV